VDTIFSQGLSLAVSLIPVFFKYIDLIQLGIGLLLVMIGVLSMRSIQKVQEGNLVKMYSELHEDIVNPVQTIDSALRSYRLRRQTDQIAAEVELDLAFCKLRQIERAAKAIQTRAHYNSIDSRDLLGPVALQLTMENAIARCQESAEDNEVHINYQPNRFAGIMVFGRQDYLETVFVELIRNAIKYRDDTKEHCNVLICGSMSRKHLTVSVEDNGLGMSKKRLRSLGRKHQIPSVRKAHIGGSGTGLKNIYIMLRICNGSIHWSSLKNKGTKADVKLRPTRMELSHC